jgi:para-aminobenzoate synthetase/4-amino-4-deoxychorismate lyase
VGGAWCTPALASGLLPGVGRQWLIDHGGVRECVLKAGVLLRAEQVAVVNSLRGVLAATL